MCRVISVSFMALFSVPWENPVLQKVAEDATKSAEAVEVENAGDLQAIIIY